MRLLRQRNEWGVFIADLTMSCAQIEQLVDGTYAAYFCYVAKVPASTEGTV